MESQTSIIKNFIAGGVGGASAILVGQPFDIIKLRLQTQPKPTPGQRPLYTGTWDCLIKTIRAERFFGLYKGMSVPLMMTTPITAVCFTGFSLGKMLQQGNSKEPLTSMQILYAGILAGLFASTLTAPAERVKILLQAQTAALGTKLSKGPFDVAKGLYREGGIGSLYRGMVPTVFREVLGCGCYFPSYLLIRRGLASENENEEFSPLRIICAGGTAGVISWTVGIGPDVVKSRLQIAPEGKYPNGMRSVVAEMFRKEGPTSLFKGIGPVLIRAFPGNGALFLGYETANKFMNWVAPDL
ncbi:mitochondrial carnitine/acylcarnitine carrier protein-like [Macrobrachium rosenbergii]|uniref:mitochondrial carnitine/acylcarnitine carrier protein-like n=1 Tax=Macrobrachium rosenbergii TaxID=79674 RepID=UPI0034D51B97